MGCHGISTTISWDMMDTPKTMVVFFLPHPLITGTATRKWTVLDVLDVLGGSPPQKKWDQTTLMSHANKKHHCTLYITFFSHATASTQSCLKLYGRGHPACWGSSSRGDNWLSGTASFVSPSLGCTSLHHSHHSLIPACGQHSEASLIGKICSAKGHLALNQLLLAIHSQMCTAPLFHSHVSCFGWSRP